MHVCKCAPDGTILWNIKIISSYVQAPLILNSLAKGLACLHIMQVEVPLECESQNEPHGQDNIL